MPPERFLFQVLQNSLGTRKGGGNEEKWRAASKHGAQSTRMDAPSRTLFLSFVLKSGCIWAGLARFAEISGHKPNTIKIKRHFICFLETLERTNDY